MADRPGSETVGVRESSGRIEVVAVGSARPEGSRILRARALFCARRAAGRGPEEAFLFSVFAA